MAITLPGRSERPELPETRGYRLKRALLGKPLVSEQLSEERLSNPTALGVLSPDCISSTAYGTEEMLTILIPAAGVAAFSLLLPVTAAIILVLFFVTLSYREVVMVYTKAGGSYVVARDNFGPKTAQISAVALMIDYTVTVAVQSAAGTNALTSAVPSLVSYQLEITVAVVVLLVYGNLRGIKEAGRVFAIPTYLFIVTCAAVIIVGIIREAVSGLPKVVTHAGVLTQTSNIGHTGSEFGLLQGVAIFYLLKAFANGGSSLTGLEAISNGVAAFRPPEGRNARKTLVVMSTTLGCLVLGVSYLAHVTHATPYSIGSPTVLSQEARAVFGSGGFGHALYLIVQLATLLILYTGANTSFNGFPYLASFVAEDRFLPRKLTKRGHRLVFSNGIIVLAVLSIALLVITDARVDSLVAVYAIGVFTGFTMAGAGMSRHHLRRRERRWPLKLVINGFAAILSLAVVIIFAVTKFTQGAWAVVVLFPILWYGLNRLHRRYQEEASVLGETVAAAAAAETRPLPRSVALIFVDRLDLATARAIQYARSLTLDDLRAVHFVIDTQVAEALQERWTRLGLSRFPLELADCPDRRVVRAALERADAELDGRTQVSVLLPRRSYQRAWSRLLHDSVGERIAGALSRLPNVSATIVPFDVDGELRERRLTGARGRHGERGRVESEILSVLGVDEVREAKGAPDEADGAPAGGQPPGREEAPPAPRAGVSPEATGAGRPPGETPVGNGQEKEVPVVAESDAEKDEDAFDRSVRREVPGVIPIGQVHPRQQVRVAGRVVSVTVNPWGSVPTLECQLRDDTGRLIVAFLGRRQIAGVVPGARMLVSGVASQRRGRLVIINPDYDFLSHTATG